VSIPVGSTRVVTEAGGPRRPRGGGGGVISFDVSETRGGGGAAGEPPRAIFGVELEDPNAARSRATVRSDCLEATATLRRSDLTLDRPTRSISEVGARRGTSLRLGAALTWADGSPAGRVAQLAALDGSPRPDGPRFCFDHPLRPGTPRASADDTLTLCVERSAIASRGGSRPFGGR
jgi:hypothetical protein